MSESKIMTPAEFEALLDRLEIDIHTLSAFVHGDETTTVALGGADTDSLRRLVAKIRADQGDLLAVMRNLAAEARTAEEGAAGYLAQVEALADRLAEVTAQAGEILAAAESAIRYGREAVDAADQARDHACQADAAAERAEASANEASARADKILELGVAAETLEYTRPATAAYDPARALMTFGLPQGEPGAPGLQGPPGPAPVSGIIDGGGAAETRLDLVDGGWVREG